MATHDAHMVLSSCLHLIVGSLSEFSTVRETPMMLPSPWAIDYVLRLTETVNAHHLIVTFAVECLTVRLARILYDMNVIFRHWWRRTRD